MSLTKKIGFGLGGLAALGMIVVAGNHAWATPGPGVIRLKAGCVAKVARPKKRVRCVACIKKGGHFHKRGGKAGFCHWRPKDGVIHGKGGCKTRIVKPGKKARCKACVAKGGWFHKMGGKRGYCNPRK